jgi:hypothetical protein
MLSTLNPRPLIVLLSLLTRHTLGIIRWMCWHHRWMPEGVRGNIVSADGAVQRTREPLERSVSSRRDPADCGGADSVGYALPSTWEHVMQSVARRTRSGSDSCQTGLRKMNRALRRWPALDSHGVSATILQHKLEPAPIRWRRRVRLEKLRHDIDIALKKIPLYSPGHPIMLEYESQRCFERNNPQNSQKPYARIRQGYKRL